MGGYTGQTPLGNLATSQLYKQYQDYVISAQEMGQPAMEYDQWFQTMNPMMQSGLNPQANPLQGENSLVMQ